MHGGGRILSSWGGSGCWAWAPARVNASTGHASTSAVTTDALLSSQDSDWRTSHTAGSEFLDDLRPDDAFDFPDLTAGQMFEFDFLAESPTRTSALVSVTASALLEKKASGVAASQVTAEAVASKWRNCG